MTTIDPRELLSNISRLEQSVEEIENIVISTRSFAAEAQEQARNAAARASEAEEAVNRLQSNLRTTKNLLDEMRTAANQLQ